MDDDEMTPAERLGAIVDCDDEVRELEREIVAALKLAITDERKVARISDLVLMDYRCRVVSVAAGVPA